MRYATNLLKKGADSIYTFGMIPERIKILAKHKIACVAHVGFIPYHSSLVRRF